MNKNIIPAVIALVISIVVGVFFVGHTGQSNLGSVNFQADVFPAGIAVGNVPTTRNEVGGTIKIGSNQTFWKNTTGKIVYFDYADAATIATTSGSNALGVVATSSYRVIMGTSTASTISDFSTPNSFNSSMLLWVIATSTIANSLTASTTNSVVTGQLRQVGVAPNNYLITAVLQGATGAPSGQCGSTTACETATSTNRGFNLKWTAKYHD